MSWAQSRTVLVATSLRPIDVRDGRLGCVVLFASPLMLTRVASKRESTGRRGLRALQPIAGHVRPQRAAALEAARAASHRRRLRCTSSWLYTLRPHSPRKSSSYSPRSPPASCPVLRRSASASYAARCLAVDLLSATSAGARLPLSPPPALPASYPRLALCAARTRQTLTASSPPH